MLLKSVLHNQKMYFFYPFLVFAVLHLCDTSARKRKIVFQKRYRGKCRSTLGMENGGIPDSDLSASTSQFSRNAASARIRGQGEAWCPLGIVTPDTYTYLQVDLPRLTVVTRLETQGRRRGREFTESFIVEFQRNEDETAWRRFYQKNGKEEFVANTNQYDSVFQNLDPPLIARRIRIVPFVRIPKRICLTMELYGCPWEDALLSYRIPQGHTYQSGGSSRPIMLDDTSYDGSIDHQSQTLENGLGKLTDYENGNARWKRRETPWVGWNKKQLLNSNKNGLKMLFEFNGTRNVTQINFYSLVSTMDKIDVFASAKFEFSPDGERFRPEPEVYNYAGVADNTAFPVLVPIRNAVCRYMRVTLEYREGMEWILLSEVYIISRPASISPAQQTVHQANNNNNDQTSVQNDKSKTSERRNIGQILVYEEAKSSGEKGGAAVPAPNYAAYLLTLLLSHIIASLSF